jgi:hypothetical protein
MHPLTFHIEIDNDVLLPIQIKLLKEYDGDTPPAVSSILLRQRILGVSFESVPRPPVLRVCFDAVPLKQAGVRLLTAPPG